MDSMELLRSYYDDQREPDPLASTRYGDDSAPASTPRPRPRAAAPRSRGAASWSSLERKADVQRGPGGGSVQQVLHSASYILERGVAGGELQAAVFRALQKLPELTVLDQHATDLEGRTGVGLGVRPGTPDPTNSGYVLQLIVDPTTGRYLGSRGVSTRKDGLVPAGVETWAGTVRTDIETTPADWTPTGANRWFVYP